MDQWNRRGFLASLPLGMLGLGACTAGDRPPLLRPGAAVRSESVQLSCYSHDGQSGFTVRLGRFPELGLSWVWAHAFLPGRIWSYTDDNLIAGSLAERSDPPAAEHVQEDGGRFRFARQGAAESPTGVMLRASWRAHPGGQARRGPGMIPISLSAAFQPERVADGILIGRAEAKGQVAGTLRVGGEEVQLRGAGHYHEQVQDTPRFTQPFVYLRGSGEDFAFTFIRAVRASGAFSGREGGPIRRFEISPPAPVRRFTAELVSGRSLQGEMHETHRYFVPIFDGVRHSQIVVGTIDGHRFVGGVNDWLGEQVGYLG